MRAPLNQYLLLTIALVICLQMLPVDATNSVVVDGCQAAADTRSANSSANETRLVAKSGSSPSVVKVQFIDCILADNMDITIAIPTNGTTATDGVLIEIRNTTMQGGSLKIEPDESVSTLQDLRIHIDNARINATGDIVVVDTTNATNVDNEEVRNVTITVRHSMLSSQRGSIASILSPSITDVTVVVAGNSTLRTETGRLVASLSASRVANATLVADSSSCVGPIQMSVGGKTLDEHFGILSVLAPVAMAVDDLLELRLESVRILIADFWIHPTTDAASQECSADGSSTIQLDATANKGIAAIASIAVRHQTHAAVHMMGNNSIDFWLRGDTDVPHHLATAVLGGYAAAGVGGILAITSDPNTMTNITVALHDHASLRFSLKDNNVTASDDQAILTTASSIATANTTISATGAVSGSVEAVLGISIVSRGSSAGLPSLASIILLDHSNVLFMSSISKSGLDLRAFTPDYTAAASVLGIAINSYARDRDSNVSIALSQNSSITIYGRFSPSQLNDEGGVRKSNVKLSASTRGFSSSAVLGICFSSRSFYGDAAATFTVTDGSVVALVSSFIGNASTILDAMTTATSAVSSVLGLAVYAYSGSTPTVLVTIDRHSHLSITNAIDESGKDVSLTSTRGANYACTTVLGLAIQSQANRIPTAATLRIAESSTVSIASTVRGKNNTLSSTCLLSHCVSSVLGLGLMTYADEATTNTVFEVSDGSRFSILSSASSNNSTLFKSTTKNYVASSVLSIVTSSFAKNVENSTTEMNVTGGSIVELGTIIRDGAAIQADVTISSDSVVGAAGLVVYGNKAGTLYIGDSSSLTMSVGATNHSQINTTGDASVSAAVGVFSTSNHTSLTNTTAHLSFCGDGTVNPTAPGVGGVALDVHPNSSTTPSWGVFDFESATADGMNCSARAVSVENRIEEQQNATIPSNTEEDLSWYVPSSDAAVGSPPTPSQSFSQSPSPTTPMTPSHERSASPSASHASSGTASRSSTPHPALSLTKSQQQQGVQKGSSSQTTTGYQRPTPVSVPSLSSSRSITPALAADVSKEEDPTMSRSRSAAEDPDSSPQTSSVAPTSIVPNVPPSTPTSSGSAPTTTHQPSSVTTAGPSSTPPPPTSTTIPPEVTSAAPASNTPAGIARTLTRTMESQSEFPTNTPNRGNNSYNSTSSRSLEITHTQQAGGGGDGDDRSDGTDQSTTGSATEEDGGLSSCARGCQTTAAFAGAIVVVAAVAIGIVLKGRSNIGGRNTAANISNTEPMTMEVDEFSPQPALMVPPTAAAVATVAAPTKSLDIRSDEDEMSML